MHLSHKNDCWAELNGQAKRQTQEPVNEVTVLSAIKQIRRESESLKSIMTIKTRAERQLLELQDLLQIMGSFQNEIGITIYQKAVSHEKKTKYPYL